LSHFKVGKCPEAIRPFLVPKLAWDPLIRLPPYKDRLKLIFLTSLSSGRVMLNVCFIHRLLCGEVNSQSLLEGLAKISIMVVAHQCLGPSFMKHDKKLLLPNQTNKFRATGLENTRGYTIPITFERESI